MVRINVSDESKVPSFLRNLSPAQRQTYLQIPETLEYVPHELFETPEAEESLFGESAPDVEIPVWMQFPEVPEDIAPRSSKGRLTAKEEQHLFLRYNYARYRVCRLIEAQHKRPTANRAAEMAVWYRRAMDCRSDVVGANMALVLAMAKRTRIPNVEFAELISEGNMALLRAVEKFDASRGFKFSTYACRAILKAFNRLATKTGRYRQHFPTEFDPDLERSDYDVMKHEMQQADSVEALREILSRNTARLTHTEQTVVMERFAIGSPTGKKKTLSQVGEMVGLTNERVRQIQLLALDKIREALDREFLVA